MTVSQNDTTLLNFTDCLVISLSAMKLFYDTFLQRLSGLISNWLDVGRKLNMSDEELHIIQSDTPGGHKERVYQMLTKWKQKNGKNATYKWLGEALIKCGRRDLQQDLEQEGIL